jgi:ABC-type branched-subunit amino acid transport system ATPase component/predicted MFS family arabinose efflux permease
MSGPAPEALPARQSGLASLTAGAPLLPLLVLASLQFMDSANQSAFGVLLPNVQASFGLSDGEILAIVAVAGAASLLFTVPIAMLAERHSRVVIAIVGAVIWSSCSIGLGLATSAVLAAVMFSLTTMGQSVVFPTHNSLLADYYPVDARPKVFSVHRGGLAIGGVFGVLVGAGLASLWSWRLPFLLFPIPTAIAAMVGLRLKEPPRGVFEQEALGGGLVALPTAAEVVPVVTAPAPEPPPSFGEAWRIVWKIQTLRRIFAALPFLAAALAGFGSIAALQYQHTFNQGAVHRAFIAAPIQIFDIAGLVLGAWLSTRLARRGFKLVFRLLMAASFVAAGMSALFALAPKLWVAIVANAGISASFAVVGPGVLSSLSLAIPSRARSVGFSIGALFVLPGLVVLPIVGAVGDHVGLRYGMLVLIPVFTIGGIILGTAGKVIDADIKNVWTSLHARLEMMAARLQGELPLLSVRDLQVGYGSVRIIDSLDLEVGEGEIVALLGTNGAGKSTLLRAIGGVIEADGGAVIFDGRDVTHMPPEEIARLGVSQMPGGAGVFPSLTVEENLRAACWQERKDPAASHASVAAVLERFPTLEARRDSLGGDLSGGQQQMLALAMALLGKPRLLLIDELSLGLAPIVVEQLLVALKEIRDDSTAILLVEQSVNVALSVADRAYVMEKGAVVFAGTSAELAAQPGVLRSVYLQGARSAPVEGVAAGRGTAPSGVSALEVRNVAVAFGGLLALDEVSLSASAGSVLGVVGPNGAGKTTLFDVISGFVVPDTGSVRLGDRDVTRLGPTARARRGLGRSFQDSRLFDDLTVRGAIAVAFERYVQPGDPLSAMMRTPALVLTETAVAERVEELVEQFGLEPYGERLVSELSTGQRRLVDLVGLLAHRPSVVLLDEPASGIAQREVENLAALLEDVRRRLDATFVIVEHDIAFIRSIADELVAMDQGSVIASGRPDEVLGNEAVVAAFLGLDPVTRQRSGRTDAVEAATVGALGGTATPMRSEAGRTGPGQRDAHGRRQ